jgi:hypothetical protein
MCFVNNNNTWTVFDGGSEMRVTFLNDSIIVSDLTGKETTWNVRDEDCHCFISAKLRF